MSSRILLVEDEPGLVLTVSDLLAADCYDVETAIDGESCLAKGLEGKFEAIILDVMLPKKTRIRSMPRSASGWHRFRDPDADRQIPGNGSGERTKTRR